MNPIANESAPSTMQSPTLSDEIIVRVDNQSYRITLYKMQQGTVNIALLVQLLIATAILSFFFGIVIAIEGQDFAAERWIGVSFCLLGGLAIIPSLYALLKRTNIPVFATLTLWGTAVLGIVVGCLLLVEVEQSSNALLVFAGLIIIFGLILLDNKGVLVPLAIVLIQIYLILLKLDGKIKGPWSRVLIPLLIASLITTVLLIMLTVYLLISQCLSQNPRSLRIKLLWLVSLLLVSVVVFSLLPLSRCFITDSPIISIVNASLSLICLIILSVYLTYRRREIAVALAEHSVRGIKPMQKG